MDLVSIIGTILAFVVIIVGTILKGSTVGALWNPAAFVIVFAGTAAALLVQNQGKVLKQAFKMLSMVYRPPRHQPGDLISRIVGWSEISRRQGLLGLEPQIEAEPDPFVSKGLQLLVDGGEPEAIRSVLEVDLETREAIDLAGAKVYEMAGIYSPTLGIIGAVMGLMAVMQNLADPSKLGHGIAAAFVATIYGVALANLFMLPMAARLKGLISKQTQMREILIEGLVSIAQGDNPRQIEARLQGYVA
ncbi:MULTISPECIES: flagellar motor protein [Rhodanobacter]|uniref:Flagellar motor component n=1 Tax=Rhodanobacter denitrificans TaxID=666685 RepID=I4WYY1_9GAMM|nr:MULTISPECIES: flagellar motor protein [Rhodanobacter]AGG90051.1 flagellar motor component [Rhodanobacter denitrificans]EIM04673.1 flagellar motor component [Rhodanobacter denitrificans]UJJ50164.1 flagellar motor protein [Rhodanobacter denitrificans]UJM85442.1 flagellar motor protein [Rhodanobacter denitrificans]UJM91515.1 flagellar motor protein [Rhodanobacter denitrificans]